MKKEKKELKDPYFMYLGNLFIVQDGIGTVSDIKYVVIRDKKHIFAKPKFFAFPGGKEVLVGSYEISIEDEGIPFLINANRLAENPRDRKIDSKEVMDIIIKNNDINKLKQLKF